MRTEHPRLIDTRSATLELVTDALVEVRFKPDVRLDVDEMSELVHAKRTLLAGRNMDVLAIIPPELDFDMKILGLDHHTLNDGCGGAERLALAAQSIFNERLSSIYFRYHPRGHETRVFLTEDEARTWLASGRAEPAAI